jgi:hypothetical protein
VAVDFTDMGECSALVAELIGQAAPSDTENLLQESAGTHTGESGTVTTYRPYLAAALILERALNTRRLQEARGAVFDRASVTIRGLRRQQAAFDEKMAEDHPTWSVPAAFQALPGGGQARVVF